MAADIRHARADVAVRRADEAPRERAAEALELDFTDRLQRRTFADRLARARPHERGARRGHRLKARRNVHAAAHGHPLPIRLRRAQVDERVSALHSDPDWDRGAPVGRGRCLREAPARGTERAQRIVLMRDRHAEDHEDRVADALLDGPALGGHLGGKIREEAVEDALHPLRAELDER